MLVINKLTSPGGIRKVDLHLDTVQVYKSDGQCIVYRRVSAQMSEGIKTRDDRVGTAGT